jgi:predicted O-linked N-acetylglucosamine transferase (SPINDLY family)
MNPAELQRLFEQATRAHQVGDLASAERGYLQLLRLAPNAFQVMQMLGVLRGQQGRNSEALELFTAALRINPQAGPVWMNYGNVLRALGRGAEAVAAFDKALALIPRQESGQADILYNRAAALVDMRHLPEALAGFEAALRLKSGFPEAWAYRGYVLGQLGRPADALSSYDRALALRPNDPETLNKRGIALCELERGPEGIASFERALTLAPNSLEAWCNRANALRLQKRLDEALASCARALAINRDFAPAWDHQGIVQWEMRRFGEALASYERALQLSPREAEVWNNRAVLLRDMGRHEEALASADRALALKPDYPDAAYNRANALQSLKRLEEAMAGFEQVRRLNPAHRFGLSAVADLAQRLCDWPKAAALAPQLTAATSSAMVSPLILLMYDSKPDFQRAATEFFLNKRIPAMPPALAGAPYRHEKLRIGYLSADYNRHPVAAQLAELIEHHDRSRFEIIGLSAGRDDKSPLRARLVKGFDQFHDLEQPDSETAARRMRELEIDIAVDLGGFTLESRVDILSFRPAPLQVSYLGYPATMSAPFLDYILADAIVLPEGEDPFYQEKIVRLPHCYWPGGRLRDLPTTPSRAEAGLPADGFVFCAFNNHWKTTQTMFEIWMRLLAQVPGSVLWLKDAHPELARRLRGEAQARGVDPARLVFAPPLDDDVRHLVRQRLADLFLDTLPYNAHATASDALSAGLPLVTCLGRNFASRVAGSMLHAVGMGELVTQSLADYEALALKLAREPALLQSLRAKLAVNLEREALFDSARNTRAIEKAYLRMQEIVASGEPPQAFAVTD